MRNPRFPFKDELLGSKALLVRMETLGCNVRIGQADNGQYVLTATSKIMGVEWADIEFCNARHGIVDATRALLDSYGAALRAAEVRVKTPKVED